MLSSYPIKSAAKIALRTGLVTGVAANGAIASLRYTGANRLAIRRLELGFVMTTAFGAAQLVDYEAIIARGFTVADSGQTTLTLAGDDNTFSTQMASPTGLDFRIANTGAITAGTRTLDTYGIACAGAWANAIGAGILTPVPLITSHPARHPILLAQNEGLIVRLITAMGATGVARFFGSVEVEELNVY